MGDLRSLSKTLGVPFFIWTKGSVWRVLDALRARQGYSGEAGANAPNYCLGAAKFTAGKLVGLFPPDKSVNQFLESPEGKAAAKKLADPGKTGTGALKMHLGGDLALNANFNKVLLPAACAWGGSSGAGVAFRFDGNAANADAALLAGAVLVVGVDVDDTIKDMGRKRDHYMVMFRGQEECIWLVDSITSAGGTGVVLVPMSFRLSAPAEIACALGKTTIPCTPPFFGWYESGGTPMKLDYEL